MADFGISHAERRILLKWILGKHAGCKMGSTEEFGISNVATIIILK
jgi:hypothetical protein